MYARLLTVWLIHLYATISVNLRHMNHFSKYILITHWLFIMVGHSSVLWNVCFLMGFTKNLLFHQPGFSQYLWTQASLSHQEKNNPQWLSLGMSPWSSSIYYEQSRRFFCRRDKVFISGIRARRGSLHSGLYHWFSTVKREIKRNISILPVAHSSFDLGSL